MTTPAAHSACDKLIAIAMGQQMQDHVFEWSNCSGDKALALLQNPNTAKFVRIAPGQPGYVTRTICYPQPLKVMPEDGDVYFAVDVGRVTPATWGGYRADISSFKAGLCYAATTEGEAHAREAWQARFGQSGDD